MNVLDEDNMVSFRRPNPVVFASEPLRSTADFGLFAASLPLLLRLPKGDGRPVLVLPGFMASDTSTEPLRWLLRHLQYRTFDWDQGRNIGPTASIVDGLVDRFDQVVAETGEPVTLIGWSLGGLYSRALAERSPTQVRHVISLGSPFRLSRSQETNAGVLFDLLAPLHGRERPKTTTFRRVPYSGAPPVPSTAIFSKGDGVVPWQSCVDVPGRHSENIRVVGSHMGLGHNPAVLMVIADRLRLNRNSWSAFRPGLLNRTLYPANPYELNETSAVTVA